MKNERNTVGIVSVTFRPKSPEEIISLSKEAGLEEIEWGGDIHVPHGDIERARRVGEATRSAGLSCGSYGSYYRVPADSDGFDDVLATAEALGSDSVRIWAGTKGSADSSRDERRALATALSRDAAAAAKKGMTLSFEFHGGTLTDSADSALSLLDEAGADNIFLHWQPNQYKDVEYNVKSLSFVKERVDRVHVFAWEGDLRLPLENHRAAWERYIAVLDGAGQNVPYLLEFLPSEDRESLMRDARSIKNLLKI
ncbi:MAG: TIM barrel protein [Clostridiales bacterium]|nr:TIM barrel protein [Clostridiales bacterium]